MSSAEQRRAAWPAAAGAVCVLAYLARPSAFYNFDGVACAIAVDLGEFSRLAHGNHLAYGLVGLAFHRFWALLGYQGTAILPLQVLDSLLGGLGAGLFCRLLMRRAALKGPAAAAAAFGLAFSYAWWFWSLEAQVYLLGAVFMLFAADEALAETPRPWLVGLWQALAVLGHVGHVMLTPAVLFLLWGSQRRAAALRSYAFALAGVVVAAYASVWCLFIHPHDFATLRSWLLGSAALQVGGEFTWYSRSPLENLRDWALMSLRIFSDARAVPSPWTWVSWTLGGLGIGAAAWGAKRAGRLERAALVWLAGYGLLFASWQPFTIVYRVSDLVPLWLLIALALRSRPAVLAAAAGSLAAFNGLLLILPQTDALSNAAYQEALLVRETVPEPAWVLVSGMGQVYVPYFAARKPLNMRYLEEPGRLEARLDLLLAAGQEVYVSPTVLWHPPWRARLEAYGLQDSKVVPLKAGARKGSPKAKARRG